MVTFFPVGAAIGRAEIPGLCAELAGVLRDRPCGVVICEIAGPGRASVAVVEALARLRLTARRYGWQLRVTGTSPELRELIDLLGLSHTLLPDEGGYGA